MSTFKDFIASSLSDFTTPAIRRPVEDIIYETLDRRQVPTRTDFHELRDIANGLRGQISSSTQGIKQILEAEKDMMARMDHIEETIQNMEGQTTPNQGKSDNSSFQKDLSVIQQELQELKIKMEANQNSIAQLIQAVNQRKKSEEPTNFIDEGILEQKISHLLEQKIQELTEQQLQNVTATKETKSCLVSGCQSEARAKSFCNPHYQQWRRKTLNNFVSIDNEVVFENGTAVKVDQKFAAKPYEESDGTINIDNGALYVRVD